MAIRIRTASRTIDEADVGARRRTRPPAWVVRRSLDETNRPVGFFACECDRPDCAYTVPLTAAEYDAIRPAPILSRAHRP
jgi:hypothetical protein